MMENKVVKAIAVGGSKSKWASIYELELWFNSYDESKRGKSEYVSYDALLDASGGKKGWNFKLVNKFLSTKEGLDWVNDVLNKRSGQ